jgi:hypothetical protein
MRPLRYSINVTLDGCCDHRAIPADEELYRHAVENLEQADAWSAPRNLVHLKWESLGRLCQGGTDEEATDTRRSGAFAPRG